MHIKYAITSNNLKGVDGNPTQTEVQFKFNLNGILSGVEIMGEVNEPSTINFFSKLPLTKADFLKICAINKVTPVEIKPDLSFENFWNRYNYKDGGSKTKAEISWNKLSLKDKSAALDFIQKYEQILIRQGVGKMHGVTYLNQKRWNN